MTKEKSDSKQKKVGRRDFLTTAAIPVVAAMLPTAVAQQAPARANNPDTIRVGIIGAGANVRAIQIPGFNRLSGCEVTAVANRSLESSQRVANEFNIPKAYGNWEQLLADDEIDAVLIGTWPYMHRELTIASLQSGKHVLCQARMANDAEQAREMLAASRRYPQLVAQLVPTSTSYVIDNILNQLLAENFVGDVLSVEVQRIRRSFADYDGSLDWRHSREFSGVNVLNLGSTYESMMRWFGSGNGVMAQTRTHVTRRRDENGATAVASLPDHLDVLYELGNEAQVHMRLSETTGLSSGNQTWIHGSEGTIYVDGDLNVSGGRRGDSQLTTIPNPRSEQASYRVEEEFINAIRGIEPVTMNTFDIGVQYMDFTQAVHLSAESGQTIDLPLS